MDHTGETEEERQDRLVGYALEVLEPTEMTAVEAHLASCAECRAELATLEPAVRALAIAADTPDLPVPAGHAERFAARLAAAPPPQQVDNRPLPADGRADLNPQGRGLVPAPPPIPFARPADSAGGRRRLPAWVTPAGWAVAAVLALALVLGGLWGADQARQATAAQTALAALTQEQATAAALLGSPDVEVHPLAGTGVLPGVDGNLWIDRVTNRALLVTRNLPAPAAGQTYELWLIATTPVAAGVFQPAGGGAWLLIDAPPGPLGTFKVAAVTAEPIPGTTAPTGQILLKGGF